MNELRDEPEFTGPNNSSSLTPRRWTLALDHNWTPPIAIPSGPHLEVGERVQVMPVSEHEHALRAVRDVELGEMHGEHLRLREAAQALVDAADEHWSHAAWHIAALRAALEDR